MTFTPGPTQDLDRPLFLRRLSTDEYRPNPYTLREARVVARTIDRLRDAADDQATAPWRLAAGRAGTAAGLLELNAEAGDTFFDVSPDALRDDATADAAFDGPELVIDVQTHFMAPHCQQTAMPQLTEMYLRAVMPDWWKELDGIVAYDLAAYLTNVFLKTETAVAVLTSGPGHDEFRHLFNDEMAATRALIDGLAGTGRLLNHSVVHPNTDGEIEAMERWRDEYRPAGWKVYTLGETTAEGIVNDWKLTDDNGMRFLERARELDVRLICAHKGISFLAENGSPADIGPAAAAFPDLDFIVYHSGYEMPAYGAPEEGPYSEATAGDGVNRLIAAVEGAGIGANGRGAGGNVYAELGSTWFCLLRRPVEAAHVLGKLIATLGEDNVIWGTDGIWYGSSQPLIDAFRAFQIPDRMCEEFGYQPLTAETKEKILSANAARVYGIDVAAMRDVVKRDDLAWARQAVADFERDGFAALR